MHYANCSSYNADFDGDEMNVHLLQDEAARCEAKDIMITNNQYIVPTSSKPLRGLIQDHVCGGVLMCMLDTFLTKQQYTQLLFSAAAILITPSHPRILLLPPAIMKPVERWTGKQVISSILHNLLPLHSFGPLTVSFKSRIKESMWGQHVEESDVVISGHEMMTGVLDKNAMGATECGFVHSIYEVYGAPYAGKMLSILGLVCTAFVQTYGITCGMKDLVIQDDSNRKRLEILSATPALGFHAASEFIGITGSVDMLDLKLKKVVDQGLADKARDPTARLTLDRMTKQKMSKVTSGIIGACIPKGQLVPFPANFFDLMVSSGAKGSGVNFSQICCLLGQQELEGRRVPLMVTGKTLPCFSPFDPSPRAGGFIGDRFLTGLSPPEFYFHCMAGREGLVDTAVKTANSGYLQRCVVKHMESLTVNYDQTVRDSDGSIVQFFYGEDGLDTVKMSGLNWFTLLAANRFFFLPESSPLSQSPLQHQQTLTSAQRSLRQALQLQASRSRVRH
jgi:DNA-directed RNA polymerase I subunit RPA1